MSLAICTVASRYPEQLAICDEMGQVTYGELARMVSTIQNHLLPPSTVVIVALPGGVSFTAIQLACFEAACVFVAIPHQSTSQEAEHYLQMVSPDVIVVRSCAEQASILEVCPADTTIVCIEQLSEQLVDRHIVSWDDMLAGRYIRLEKGTSSYSSEARSIQFTSGSTGMPKGVLLSQANWQATLEQNQEHLRQFELKTVFCPLPQFHAMGNAVVVEHLFNGSTVLVANQFMPGVHVARMQESHCSAIQASPNYFKLMLRLGVLSRVMLPGLQSVTIGTAAIDQELVRDLRAEFPDLTIHCRYGLSESVGCMVRLTLGPGQQLTQPGLIGAPVAGVEFKALSRLGVDPEPDELRVRSAANAIGCITERASWSPLVGADNFLSTGDLVFVTPPGQLVVRGRLSSFLKSNGFRINPFEIEEVVRGIPAVQEAVVVGVPDPVAEQRVVACIELSPGRVAPSTETLQAVCEQALSAHKVPSRFMVLPALPRTPAGKPDRAATLAAAMAAMAESGQETRRTGSSSSIDAQVADIVANVVAENLGRRVSLSATTDLVEQGYLDSLTLVSLVVALQDELGVVIPLASLTPDQFSSIDRIVAYLASTGRGALPMHHVATQGRPAKAPNRNLVVALALAALMTLGISSLPRQDLGGLNDREFLGTKAACDGCADLVIAGSSQASLNISPSALQQEMPGTKVFNLGFSTQPYNAGYLDLIDRALRKSGHRAVLLVITPVSLVLRDNDDEAAYARTIVHTSRLEGELDRLRELVPARSPCDLGLCKQRELGWRLPDGWSPTVIEGVESFAGWQDNMQRFMRRWAAVLRFRLADTQPLLDRIRRWQREGVRVYALGAPVPPAMQEAERSLPGYDETVVTEHLRSAGANWIVVDAADYPTFDGWHMQRPVAERLSHDVGRHLATLTR